MDTPYKVNSYKIDSNLVDIQNLNGLLSKETEQECPGSWDMIPYTYFECFCCSQINVDHRDAGCPRGNKLVSGYKLVYTHITCSLDSGDNNNTDSNNTSDSGGGSGSSSNEDSTTNPIG